MYRYMMKELMLIIAGLTVCAVLFLLVLSQERPRPLSAVQLLPRISIVLESRTPPK